MQTAGIETRKSPPSKLECEYYISHKFWIRLLVEQNKKRIPEVQHRSIKQAEKFEKMFCTRTGPVKV